MGSYTLHLEPAVMPPPYKIGFKPEAKGAPVLSVLPVPKDETLSYPMNLPHMPHDDKSGQDYVWHGGRGIVINTYA